MEGVLFAIFTILKLSLTFLHAFILVIFPLFLCFHVNFEFMFVSLKLRPFICHHHGFLHVLLTKRKDRKFLKYSISNDKIVYFLLYGFVLNCLMSLESQFNPTIRLCNVFCSFKKTQQKPLMMAYEGSESALDNFNKFIYQLQPKTKALVRKLEGLVVLFYCESTLFASFNADLNFKQFSKYSFCFTNS